MSISLFIVIQDCGDGSSGLSYTLDEDLITYMEDNVDTLPDSFQSGDGVQVSAITVPEGSTYESLSIPWFSILKMDDLHIEVEGDSE